MIEWLEENEFEGLFLKQWGSDSIIFEEVAWIECRLGEIQSFAKTKPRNITEYEDLFINTSSDSGTAWRWYVAIDNKLGLITYYDEGADSYVAIELPRGTVLDSIESYIRTFKQLGLDVKST
ncbi:hypothetical protein [Aestuariibacter sp. A3R04]|uniref:hypothetical protein n=1 Tax=Aestuariibacter sp. A3R04 TaxID=2841571 RepID=UPI001C08EA53|nr:hypothetical protein [Aestuariibacter sp. A3R04]MBU3023950.1 hypothetical protein [Aestuariibacter sp. A3R04]